MKPLNILIACEESQAFCSEFRLLGQNAFSCDLQECSGNLPQYHIIGDALILLPGKCTFTTMTGATYFIAKWDLLVAHPPCTYLACSSAVRMFPGKILNKERYLKMLDAKRFFLQFLNCDIHYICVENPVPLKICGLPKPTTFIEPYWFGHPFSKKTLLWLRNLPPVFPTRILAEHRPWVCSTNTPNSPARSAEDRSKTFQGFANAAAKQWLEFIRNERERSE